MDHSPLLNPETVGAATTGLPANPGLYAWWLADPQKLPQVPLTPRADGLSLIYLGIAKSGPNANSDLRSRVLGKHIRGSLGNSTLRRSLAALLWEEQGWKPIWPSDRVLLSPEENLKLSQWMAQNLRVAWLPHPEPWKVEAELISVLQPPLNVMANQSHSFYPVIKAARARLEAAARGEVVGAQTRVASTPPAPQAGEVTAAQLADQLGVDAKTLRVKLRGLAKQGKIADNSGRWAWSAGSPDLEVIRESWRSA